MLVYTLFLYQHALNIENIFSGNLVFRCQSCKGPKYRAQRYNVLIYSLLKLGLAEWRERSLLQFAVKTIQHLSSCCPLTFSRHFLLPVRPINCFCFWTLNSNQAPIPDSMFDRYALLHFWNILEIPSDGVLFLLLSPRTVLFGFEIIDDFFSCAFIFDCIFPLPWSRLHLVTTLSFFSEIFSSESMLFSSSAYACTASKLPILPARFSSLVHSALLYDLQSCCITGKRSIFVLFCIHFQPRILAERQIFDMQWI